MYKPEFRLGPFHEFYDNSVNTFISKQKMCKKMHYMYMYIVWNGIRYLTAVGSSLSWHTCEELSSVYGREDLVF